MDRRIAKNHRIILDTALRLYLEEGAEAVTVERLASEAELSRATVYNHFQGLEGVVDELVLPALEMSISTFKQLANSRNKITFDHILTLLLHLWKENRDSFLAACMNIIPLHGELERLHEEFVVLFRDVLSKVDEAGRFRIPDIPNTAYLVFRTFPEVLRAVGNIDNSEDIFRACMRGLVLTDQAPPS